MSSPDTSGFVRIFDQARSAHFERLGELTAALFVYRRRSYDFEPGPAHERARALSRVRTLSLLIRERPRVVEINEPGAINTWPSTIPYVAVIRAMNRFGLSATDVVVYAIENGDPIAQVGGRLRLPRPLAAALTRAVFRFLVPRGTRFAFGTDQAREQYLRSLPDLENRARTTVFDPLAPRCTSCDLASKDEDTVAFVGSFEARKGLPELLDEWPRVKAVRPNARLHLLGQGPLAEEVIEFASGREEVSVTIDPTRSEIHRALASATSLALPSRRHRYWREQIGLPILEGLSHGCEIVTTDETGIASWLREHGHQVVRAHEPGMELANAIERSLSAARPVAEVLAGLPQVDGRTRADRWLFDA
jgi:glycosyltransferase involved in cell wall biosynthesis